MTDQETQAEPKAINPRTEVCPCGHAIPAPHETCTVCGATTLDRAKKRIAIGAIDKCPGCGGALAAKSETDDTLVCVTPGCGPRIDQNSEPPGPQAGYEFLRYLQDAGVISSNTERVLIDITADDFIRVYETRLVDSDMLDILMGAPVIAAIADPSTEKTKCG